VDAMTMTIITTMSTITTSMGKSAHVDVMIMTIITTMSTITTSMGKSAHVDVMIITIIMQMMYLQAGVLKHITNMLKMNLNLY
jgi:hypothetical protein